MTEILSKQDVIDWINYYEEGDEIPDNIMTSLLYMAQLYSENNEQI